MIGKMNTITSNEVRAIIDAFDRDSAILYRQRGSNHDWIVDYKPSWDFVAFEYQGIPKPLEVWINIYEGGLFPNTLRFWESKEKAASDILRGSSGKPVKFVASTPLPYTAD